MHTSILISIILAILLIVFILILKHLRDIKYISPTFFRQVVSSTISGVIVAFVAFFSAYSLWQIQEKQAEEQRINDARDEALITLQNEILENRLILEGDIQSDSLVRMPLKTSAWDTSKYKLVINPELKCSLLMLYNNIEKYNWDIQFIQNKVKEGKLTSTKWPEDAKKAQAVIDRELLDALVAFEKLISRELVIVGYMSKDDYVKGYGKWEDEVNTPSIKQR